MRSGRLRSVSLEVQHFVRERGRHPLYFYLYETWFLIYNKIIGLFKFDTYPKCDSLAGNPKETKNEQGKSDFFFLFVVFLHSLVTWLSSVLE